jgi:hypothetical protein
VYSKELEEDLETLRFSVKGGKQALEDALTPAERSLFACADQALIRKPGGLTYSELQGVTKPKSSKALAQMLAKAQEFQIFNKAGQGKGALYSRV